jgi:GntR family transcriptional regulator
MQKLDLQIRRQLLNEITHGIYANAQMLPSETELCERLDVSRSTLRQAVTALEQEHYLRRRQGIGTEIDRHVCSMKGRIDLNPEFSTFLSELGYVPERKFLEANLSEADSLLADQLMVELGETILSITKMWNASGKPAIWCTDFLPASIIRKPYTESDLNIDIFTFLKNYCNQQISFQISSIELQQLDEQLSSVLGLRTNDTVFMQKCVGYNLKGQAVLASRELYVPDYVSFTVLRAKV